MPAGRSARALIIVARDQPELYEYLRGAFAGLSEVDVILDRRLPGSQPGHESSETAARRREPDIYDELALRGFVVKRLQ